MREQRNDPKRLKDILQAIDTIFEYVGGRGMEEFLADRRSYHAGMNSSNNLIATGNDTYYDAEIASIGKVNGLSNIKDIPETGWTNQTTTIPGCGYVHRTKYRYRDGYAYTRIYVVDYMTSTSGGIMGITIKYQENWEPDAK